MDYFNTDGSMRKELLDTDAAAKALQFVGYDRDKKIINKPSRTLSSSQLRRFYSEFKRLEKQINTEAENQNNEELAFNRVLPLIKMVKSKAAYAANPAKQKIPATFKDFLTTHVDHINEKRDFDAFMLHFEAVVGFFYGLGIKNE